MCTLSLTARSTAPSRYYVELTSVGLTGVSNVQVEFDLPLDDARRERFRWYFEEYLQYPFDPAPSVAAAILLQLKEFGESLFRHLFDSSEEGRHLWLALESRIADARFELHAAVDQSAALPWELLCDPKSGVRPSLAAKAFVRCTSLKAALAPVTTEVVRLLLIIARPLGGQDVPFRAVAARLADLLGPKFEITALRPPTYQKFQQVLEAAAAAARPFHIVHFDGHGTFTDLNQNGHKRGYILFEDEPTRYVSGDRIGKLLRRTGTPVLVLNACQSARAEAKPQPAGELAADTARAYLSFAHETVAAGVVGVVAMSYSIFVDTAAQFIAALYLSLAAGTPLGEAVAEARRHLAADSRRTLWFESRAIEDWPVPVVYENHTFQYRLSETVHPIPPATAAPSALPERPKPGFIGRDASLLALDRAFDRSPVVLLHGFAGSGKTVTMAEFARWYQRTGGVPSRHAIYTSFEHYLSLSAALDQLAHHFRTALDVNWSSLSNPQARRAAAIRLLQAQPLLWIWDNVEPVSGFPSGIASVWTPAEQLELSGFLRDASATQAKILLASRTTEQPWLSALPLRIELPALSPLESFQLAAAVARDGGDSLGAASHWMPLLEFSGGNPMTLTVFVRQALHMRLSAPEDIASFVQRLRAGEAEFTDPQSESRSASLAASLQYGFDFSFNETERRQLALLQLFQGFVDAETLDLLCTALGEPAAGGVNAISALLQRAAAIGQLTWIMNGFYTIHPALPWFFRRMLKNYFAGREDELARAFVRAEAHVGKGVETHYEMGDHGIVAHLRYEEANLIHALNEALRCQMWDETAALLGPLSALYVHSGRHIEWARLVERIAALSIDLVTLKALPGVSERAWSSLLWYHAELNRQTGRLETAASMQVPLLEYAWQAAHALVDRAAVDAAAAVLETESPENLPFVLRVARNLKPEETAVVTTVTSRLNAAAQIQRALGQRECVENYKRAWAVGVSIGDWRAASACCDNLMHSYTGIAAIKDLDKAMYWANKSLELAPEVGPHWWPRAYASVGRVWRHRYLQALAAGKPQPENLIEAERVLLAAETWLGDNCTLYDKLLVHNELGNLYTNAGRPREALDHLQQALRFQEQSGDIRGAADLRFNIALLLGDLDDFEPAILYAEAARAGYQALNLQDSFQGKQTALLLQRLAAGIRPGAQ